MNDKWVPLQYACKNGFLEIVKCLVEKGADVNSREKEMKTPLHYASAHGHFFIVKYLVDHGADVNAMGNLVIY